MGMKRRKEKNRGRGQCRGDSVQAVEEGGYGYEEGHEGALGCRWWNIIV